MKNLIFAVLVGAGSLVRAQGEKAIAVMDLKAQTGIDGPTASMLTDVLCTEIKDLGNYKVISREDIKAMLSHVKDQQLLGCDDTKCLAEIGGALGVSLLVYGNIGKLGAIYLVNLKLIDIEKAEVVNRITEEFEGGEGGLIQLVRTSARVLFEKGPAPEPEKTVRPEPPPGPRKAVAKPDLPRKEKQPRSKVKFLRYGLLTAGVAASVTTYLVYNQGKKLHDNEYANAATAEDEAKYWSRLEGYNTGVNVLLGTSGALLLGGVITFVF